MTTEEMLEELNVYLVAMDRLRAALSKELIYPDYLDEERRKLLLRYLLILKRMDEACMNTMIELGMIAPEVKPEE